MFAAVNLAARFFLELAGIAALAYAGYQSSTSPFRWLAAVAAPAALIAFWAVIVAPRAVNPIPLPVREGIGTIVLLASAAALAASGQPELALVLGVLTVANNVLIVVLRDGTPVAEVLR